MPPAMFPQNKVGRRVSGIEQVFVLGVVCLKEKYFVIKESRSLVAL